MYGTPRVGAGGAKIEKPGSGAAKNWLLRNNSRDAPDTSVAESPVFGGYGSGSGLLNICGCDSGSGWCKVL